MKNICFSLLLSISLQGICQDLPTIGEIFNFEIGDEFHFEWASSYPNAHGRKIIDKAITEGQDSIKYTRALVSFSDSDWSDTIPGSVRHSYDELIITNLDSTIDHYLINERNFSEPEFFTLFDTIFSEYCNKTTVEFRWSYGDDGYGVTYARDMGQISEYEAGSGLFFEKVLNYSKKGQVICGSPDPRLYWLATKFPPSKTISIIPNPATNAIRILGLSDIDDIQLTIIGITGISFYSRIINIYERIDISYLEVGYYILELKCADFYFRTKFMKE